MSRYTLELYQMVDFGYDLFGFDYDFYDNAKKADLQDKFYEHFKFNEIGSETPERFLDRFKSRWLEVIPKYSKMFETNERLFGEIDILTNYSTESQTSFNDTPKGEIEFDNIHATAITKTKTKGYTGTTGVQLLKDFNQNFINILDEFFKEFQNLFMQIY